MTKPHNANNVRKSFPSPAENTIVGTAETFTAIVAPVTSWPYPPILDLCGYVTCATPCCCREAHPQAPDRTTSSHF